MSASARRAAGALFRRALTRLGSRFPPGSADTTAATFDALQEAAFTRRGWPGLVWCWLREAASLVRLSVPRLERRSSMGFLRHDLRDAWRELRRSPGYAALVVATLALCIGVNSAIFSVVDALLFKSLPYADPDRLVYVSERHPTGGRNTVAPANFLDWQQMARSFAAIEARHGRSFALLDGGDPVELRGARVSVGYFDLLGVGAAEGRTFIAADADPAAPCVVVISHRLWANRFGADRGKLGTTVRFSGEICTLVGVLPEGSVFDRVTSDVYTPLVYAPGQATRVSHMLAVTARLAPGVTLEQARGEMADLAARINVANPEVTAGWSATVDPLRDLLVRDDSRRLVWVLSGAVALVLLVGCVNIAGLALSRSIARRREVAVRLALGAGRWRVFRGLVVESLMLASFGGALGLVAGRWALAVFTAAVPRGTLPAETLASLDARALVFTGVLAIVTGLFFGTLPAWQSTRDGVSPALQSGGRGASSSRSTSRMHSALLVTEVALAMVLVAGAALLVASFMRLTRVDPGFRPEGVVAMRLALPVARYPTETSYAQFFQRALDEVRRVPGVSHAAAVTSLPLGGWLYGQTFVVEGAPDPGRVTAAHIQHVSGDYLAALGMRLAEGRAITDEDTALSPGVVMVNETFARRFVGNPTAVGRFIRVGGATESRLEIVGVMRDVKTGGLGDDPLLTPEMYVSLLQYPMASMSLAVRASDPPRAAGLVREIRARIRNVDPELPIGDPALMTDLIGVSVTLQRFRTAIVASFALLAGLLACIGVYAVRSQAVHARRRDVGIRMALGATPGHVLYTTVVQGLRLVAVGLIVGAGATLVLSRGIESWLFATSAADPVILMVAAAALGLAGLAASWIPARRAASVDPVTTLRAE